MLWPQGFEGGFEWLSALVALATFIALFRLKRGVVEVIAACAAVGLLVTLIK